MKLDEGGMTLRSHGQQFLDLVEHIEAASNGGSQKPLDRCGKGAGQIDSIGAFQNNGGTP
jgi:hypothetical protein